MSGWSIFVDAFVLLASLVAILDYFGVKPKQRSDGTKMSLSRRWKLAIMLTLVAASLALSGYGFYRSLHPRIVERIIEKPVDRIVEKMVPKDCPMPDNGRKPAGKGKQMPTAPVSEASPPSVTQGPGSAFSNNQQGGITAGTINLGPSPLVINPAQQNALANSVRPFASQFPTGEKINISLHNATGETWKFGSGISDAFHSAGFAVNMGSVQFVGAALDHGVTIRFGKNREALATAVMQSLLSSGAVAKVYRSSGLNDDDFLIIVAP
jgi:hypothetical protein